ncbi:MAG: zinc metalloprotease HtpX [Desulfurococcales archaeon ex4484_217_2]|nr:MAG: zinc metalloprotease HtpX [Desulfurococcales archaeon ex4484_217_2]
MQVKYSTSKIPAPRVSLWKLRLSMLGTMAAITAIATLVFVTILTWLNISFYGFYGIIGFIVAFHLFQWIIGPYVIDAVYHVRPLSKHEYPELHDIVEKIAKRSGLKYVPKLMIAEIDIPNAFAYGNPFTGYRVAVTRGLLETLPLDEVEAVLGHELGHLKHRDVVVMLMISIIPAIIYYIGYVLYVSGWFSGFRRERESGGPLLLLVGILLMAVSYLLNLFVFYMSRLREYYADSHAALNVTNGARKLQRALARIMYYTSRMRRYMVEGGKSYSHFKMFFITDPDKQLKARYIRDIDQLVEDIKRQKPSILEELFSTHPHPAKRLRHLDKFITGT